MNDLLTTIRTAGLSIRLVGKTLKVTPAALLTPALQALIRNYKGDLVQALAEPACDDTRVTCTNCENLKPGNRCCSSRRAGLTTKDLAGEFVRLRQHCQGFASRAPP